MKEKLGRWIKTIERLPGLSDKVQWRLNGEERDGTETIAEVTFLGAAAFAKYEWKDESPTTADASVLKEALEKLVIRVQNYFDELKENPRNKANGLSKMKNYLAFAIDDARKILAQYCTQSPSSIEESGLKEGEGEQELWVEALGLLFGIENWPQNNPLNPKPKGLINMMSKYHITRKP